MCSMSATRYGTCVMPFVMILLQHKKVISVALAKMEGVSFTFRNFCPHIRLPVAIMGEAESAIFQRKVMNPQGMPLHKPQFAEIVHARGKS